jgi:hypothetical protein
VTGDLTAGWRALAPEAAGEHRFPASLGLPDDLIGPGRVAQQPDVTCPVLLDLIRWP